MKIRNYKRGPEAEIQDDVIKKLEGLKWMTQVMHGNLYQYGVPDLYVAHKSYGARWVECKRDDGKHAFTPAQITKFPEFASAGVGIWIVTSADQVPDILFKPPNWYMFLPIMQVHTRNRS